MYNFYHPYPHPHQQFYPPPNKAAGYATIPTSAANNQAYIIGQLINSSQPSILQQHSQQGKPGEMQKVQKYLQS